MPAARKDSASAQPSAQAQQEAASDGIDSYELPKSIVTRIAKSALPENSKLQKDTVLALVKGSTVFINYLAATAHDIASSRQHKSVSASDVLKALEMIQFGDMVDGLQEELKVYRENAKNSKKGSKTALSASKGRGKERAATPSQPETGTHTSQSAAGVSIGQVVDGDDVAIDEDEDMDDGRPEDEVDVDQLEEDEQEDELIDDVEDDDDDGEPLEDRMAVEEEELRQDMVKADLGHPTEAAEGK